MVKRLFGKMRLLAGCLAFLALLSLAPPAAAGEHWQRIVCIDEPRVTVTLLLKSPASPADEEFVGWELHNRTDKPLHVGNLTHYRLDQVQTSNRDDGKPLVHTNMASGNVYDVLWRDGARPPRDGARREDALPPGVTRRVGYSSIYSLAILGIPPGGTGAAGTADAAGGGWRVEGQAHFRLDLARPGEQRDLLETPQAGVPFRFDWLPPDDAGVESLQRRLMRALSEPGDSFADAYLLSPLLKDSRIASAASVNDLLAAVKRHDTVVRPALVKHLDEHHADDEAVVTFFLKDVIAERDLPLLRELRFAERIRDRRLIEPLVQWIRDDRPPHEASPVALEVLKRHRDLMGDDRAAIAAELGQIMLPRTRYIAREQFPQDNPWYWSRELRDLVHTGDPALVRQLTPYLRRTDIVEDARLTSMPNNGVSTRACDVAYNAIHDLLDRPGERFTMSDFSRRPEPRAEYRRRDAAIEKLMAELGEAGD